MWDWEQKPVKKCTLTRRLLQQKLIKNPKAYCKHFFLFAVPPFVETSKQGPRSGFLSAGAASLIEGMGADSKMLKEQS